MQNAAAAIERLCDPAAKVSAHYVVDEDGKIQSLVPEAERAWHAGESYWRGRRALNDCSIGIEIVNPGHEWGYRPFPEVQMQAVATLCQTLIAKYPIPSRNIVGHSDIAPDRKQDPGELFPWRWLAAQGISLWVDDLPALPTPQRNLLEMLDFIGYDIASKHVVTSFQRHFCSEDLNQAVSDFTLKRVFAIFSLLQNI